MGIFNFLKKPQNELTTVPPYSDPAANLFYNQLFCDNIQLYKSSIQQPHSFPFDVLFSEKSSSTDLKRIIDNPSVDSRFKILAYNKLLETCNKPDKTELFAVIVEMGLEKGLDVFASYKDGTARYLNHSGNISVWETNDKTSNELTVQLFSDSQKIINKIGPWDKPRRPYPTKGNLRITFLVSDGLYFGEGPIHTLFNNPMANPALENATRLMKYLSEKAMERRTS